MVRTRLGTARRLLISLQRVEVGDELCALSIVYDESDQSAPLDRRRPDRRASTIHERQRVIHE